MGHNGHLRLSFADRRMSFGSKRLLVRGQEEHDAQEVDDAQKHKPSKQEVEGKIDQFSHLALRV